MSHDVFISHPSADKPIADAICAAVESKRIRCWIAPRDVCPSSSYAEEIDDALGSCQLVVLVFSQNCNGSAHILREIEGAISHGVPIVPFRIDSVAPSKALNYYLKPIHWLDALTPPIEQHLSTLVSTIERLLAAKVAERASSAGAHTDTLAKSDGLPKLAPHVSGRLAWRRGTRVVLAPVLVSITLLAGIVTAFLALNKPSANPITRNTVAGKPLVSDPVAAADAARLAEIRAQVVLYAEHVGALEEAMLDGTVLVLGAARVAEEFRHSLEPNPTSAVFRRELAPSNKAALLSIAVSGWNETPGVEQLNKHLAEIKRISTNWPGGLTTLGECTAILNGIVEDAYSPAIFSAIFALGPNVLLADASDDATSRDLGRILAAQLQGNSAGYFVARYENATRQLCRLVSVLAEQIASSSDATLIRILKIGVVSAAETKTHTDHLRYIYMRMAAHLPEEANIKVLQLITDLETSLSTDEAIRRNSERPSNS